MANLMRKIDMKLEGVVSDFASALSMDVGRPSTYGCDEHSWKKMIDRCRALGTKPYRAVTNWMLWHITVTDEARASLMESGDLPTIVYATIIYDEQGRMEPRSSVRTSLAKAIHDNCILETQNTFYILVGAGIEKEVSPHIVNNLFF